MLALFFAALGAFFSGAAKAELGDEAYLKIIFPAHNSKTDSTALKGEGSPRIQTEAFRAVPGKAQLIMGFVQIGYQKVVFAVLERSRKDWKLLSQSQIDDFFCVNADSIDFDLAPFRLNDREKAVGIRCRRHQEVHHREDYHEQLILFRIGVKGATRVFSEEMDFKNCAFDPGYEDNEVCEEDKLVLQVDKSKTNGMFDWRLHAIKFSKTESPKDRVFHWNGSSYEETSGK